MKLIKVLCVRDFINGYGSGYSYFMETIDGGAFHYYHSGSTQDIGPTYINKDSYYDMYDKLTSEDRYIEDGYEVEELNLTFDELYEEFFEYSKKSKEVVRKKFI